MAIAQNKRRVEALERRVAAIEEELGIDPSEDDLLEPSDDGYIVPDGGER